MSHSPEYLAVLHSPEWRGLSREVRAIGACDACGGAFPPGGLELHHWHYERLGSEGVEDQWDVSQLCGECHAVADTHRRHIVSAAKRYAARYGDPHWRRAARLLGRAFVALARRPISAQHHQVEARGLACLFEDYS